LIDRKDLNVDQRQTKRPYLQQRLDSWKSIAQYLDRSCRTVQRWHSNYNLPIHHIGGNGSKKSTIFAYSGELDDWMINRGRLLLTTPDENHGAELHQAHLVRKEPHNYKETLHVTTNVDLKKTNSSNLVTLAYKLWEFVSQYNVTMIAQYFRDAIDLDPDNAAAYAGLSLTLIGEGLWGLVRPPVAYASAREVLQRALEIDPEQPEAKYADAWLKMVMVRDWEGARLGFNENLIRRPRTRGEVLGWALLHIAEGSPKEASVLLLEAAQQYSLRSDAITLYCWSEYLSGEYANALLEIEQYRASGRFGLVLDSIEALTNIQFFEEPDVYIRHMELMVENTPNNDVLRGALGYVYGVTGQDRHAREQLDILVNPQKRGKRRAFYAIALVLLGMKQMPEAMKHLEQSYRDGSLWSLGFLSDPILASLRKEPIFQQFLSRVSYPEPQNSSLFRTQAV
jgi:tetratricopeptide (TPR) repeat protein